MESINKWNQINAAAHSTLISSLSSLFLMGELVKEMKELTRFAAPAIIKEILEFLYWRRGGLLSLFHQQIKLNNLIFFSWMKWKRKAAHSSPIQSPINKEKLFFSLIDGIEWSCPMPPSSSIKEIQSINSF